MRDPFFWPYWQNQLHLATEIGLHIGVALLVSLPLLWGLRTRPRALLAGLGLVAAGGIGIDLDHALAAWSLSPQDMTDLAARPPSHSLLFALAAGILVGRLAGPRYGWILAVALLSHYLYDSPAGGLHWLWPWTEVDRLPSVAAAVGLAATCALAGLVARRLAEPPAPGTTSGAADEPPAPPSSPQLD